MTDSPVSVTPQRCWLGSLSAGGLATACYFLTRSIATTFANKPLPNNVTAMNIAVAVRTLVVGGATLATAVFAIAALGLLALGFQLLFTRQSSEQN